jgi:hypothetical protein
MAASPDPFSQLPKISYSLPRLVRRPDGSIIHPWTEPDSFVQHELDTSRLDHISQHLWLAGRVGNIRPLHRQILLGRRVVVTEQADMHLLWINECIFIKPLPAWLLDGAFWKRHLDPSAQFRRNAYGFLRSYADLIAYESDFHISKAHHLVPEDLTWTTWLEYVQHLVIQPYQVPIPQSISRYAYGELRLSRISMLYRLFSPRGSRSRMTRLILGYHRGPETYRTFLHRNFAWLVVAFAYLAIVLTAMQTGLATAKLRQNNSFNAVSYGFVVFSLVLPLFAVLLHLSMSLMLTIYHIRATLRHLHQQTSPDISESEKH